MFGGIGAGELIVILILALIIFGPGKLPDVGKAVGKALREFKRAQTAIDDEPVQIAEEKKEKQETPAVRPNAEAESSEQA